MELTVDINSIFGQVKEILFAPKKFFGKAKKEKGWKKAFVFIIAVALVGHILTALYNIFVYPVIAPSLAEIVGISAGFDTGQVLVASVVSYVISLGMSFIWGGALKVWLALFKIESSFARSYRVMAYSRTPNYLFSWLPVVNLLAAFYSIYLLMLGIEAEYSIPRKKSVLIIILSVVAMIVLSLLVFSFLPSI